MKKFRFLILLAIFLTALLPAHAQEDESEEVFYMTADGAYSVFLPDHWAAKGDRLGVYLTSNEEVFSAGEVLPGEIAISYFIFDGPELIDLGYELDTPPIDLANEINGVFSDEEYVLVTTEGEFDMGGYKVPAAFGNAVTQIADGLSITYPIHQDTIAYAMIATELGELSTLSEDALAVVRTIRYSPALVTQQKDENNADLFSYPSRSCSDSSESQCWTVGQVDNRFTIVNKPAAYKSPDLPDRTMKSEEYVLTLLDLSNAELAVGVDDLAATLTNLAQSSTELGTNVVLSEARLIRVWDKYDVAILDFVSAEGEGGVMLLANEAEVYSISYLGATHEGYQAFQVALNILLSTQETPAPPVE